MRKILLLCVIVFVAVVAGGYCFTWYRQAENLKSAVAGVIAKANEKKTYITYETLETSGFPSKLTVSIVKPRFTGRIDEIYNAMMAQRAAQGFEVKPIPEWHEDMVLNGAISFSVDAMSDDFSAGITGDWESKSSVGSQNFSLKGASDSGNLCTLKIQKSSGMFGAMWDVNVLSDGQAFIRDFRALDCGLSPSSAINVATNEKITASGGGQVNISHAPSGGTSVVRFYMKLVDAEITPQGEGIMAAYMTAFSPENPFPPQLSAYGKQNMELDFTYSGPTDLKLATRDTPFNIQLSKMLYTSQAQEMNMTLHAVNSVTGDRRSASLKFNADSTFHEPYDQLFAHTMQNLIASIYAGKEPELARAKELFEKHSQEEVIAAISPALPNFHSLGKLTQSVDVNYEGSTDYSAGDITLNGLEMSSPLYGLTAKGAAKTAKGQITPAGTLLMGCNNCLRLIDDMAAYAARVQKAVAFFDEAEAANIALDPKIVEGLKNFLSALAEPVADGADKNLLTYTFISDGGMGMSISGKRMDEVMSLYGQHLASAMQPAAGQAEPAPPVPAQ